MDIAASFDLSKFHNVRPDVLERAAERTRPLGDLVVDSDATPGTPPEKPPEPNANGEGAAGPDPELVQLAAETEKALSRTLL